MQKILFLAFVLMLLSTAVVVSFIRPVEATATIYIKADGSVEGTTDITTDDNVTYSFTANISDSIVVEKDNIVIDGAGYTVEGSRTGLGIYLFHRSNVTVKNAKVMKFRLGILLDDSRNNTLIGNSITNNGYYGVLLYRSSNNTLRSNNMTDNGYNFGVDGRELPHFLHDIDASNLVDGKPVYYLLNQHNLIINSSTFPDSGYLALINSTKITVENLTLTNNWQGLLLANITNSSIIGNNVTNNYYGIWLSDSSNNTIVENTVTKNCEGIWLYGSSNNAIVENTVTKNYWEAGIRLLKSSNNTLSGNTMTDNSGGIGLGQSSNNTIAENTVIGSWQSGQVGILVHESSDNTLSSNTITYNWFGIALHISSNNTLRNNNMNSNEKAFKVYGVKLSEFLHDIDVSNLVDGKPIYYWVNQHDTEIPLGAGYIALVNCTDITVQNLTLTRKWQGLLFAYTNNSIITNNNIVNSEIGIDMYSSSNNTLSRNTVTYSDLYGIELRSSPNNTIAGNDVTNNDYGIKLTSSCNNTLSGNTIANNNYYGIQLYISSNNRFYRNNFINNTDQAYLHNSPNNVWDDGFEGNYWSDYTGVDANMDGIGDSSFEIGSNNTDHYPLMGMFADFPVSWEEETCHVTTVCNSTISAFEFDQVNRIISFNVTGEEDIGFCRVCIPYDLMEPPYTVTVDGHSPEYVNYTLHDNETHRWIYFTYLHSTHKVEIIPEFPTWTSTLLILIVLTVSIAIHKRRLLKTPIH